MTDDRDTGVRILGSLGSRDGMGVVRMEERLDTDIEDAWSALTEPARLADWLGEVEGELRSGGEYRYRFFASGSEGIGRVEACEPPRRVLVRQGIGAVHELAIEVTLTSDKDETALVAEERGMPLNLLAAYGAGVQIHIEDLVAHLSGHERCDANSRWDELEPFYVVLAADVDVE